MFVLARARTVARVGQSRASSASGSLSACVSSHSRPIARSPPRQGERSRPVRRFRPSDEDHREVEVHLDGLPSTTTHDDIRNLCFSSDLSQFTGSEKKEPGRIYRSERVPPPSTLRKTSDRTAAKVMLNDMIDIRMALDKLHRPNGLATVVFRAADSAEHFVRLTHGKQLGGRTIDSRFVENGYPRASFDHQQSLELVNLLRTRSPGRVVQVCGMPFSLSISRLTKIVSRAYTMATDEITFRSSDRSLRPFSFTGIVHGPMDAHKHSRSFYIRFETVADAMRLVRRWHRTHWDAGSDGVRTTAASGQRGGRRNDRRTYHRDLYEDEQEDKHLAAFVNVSSTFMIDARIVY